MEKSTVIGILLFLVTLLAGAFFTGIIKINSEVTGNVINTFDNDDTVVKQTDRQDEFIEDFRNYLTQAYDKYQLCLSKCPVNYFGYYSSSCYNKCEDIVNDFWDIIEKELGSKYTNEDIEKYENHYEIKKIGSNQEILNNCLESCGSKASCIQSCFS